MLEERIKLKDLHLTILDTAGIREHPESIEEVGIARTRRALEQADLALVILDGSQTLDDDDRRLIEETKEINRCAIINKSDLPQTLKQTICPLPLKRKNKSLFQPKLERVG